MKHTPLPWKVGDAIKFYVDSQDVGHEANVVITSAHGRIADVMGSEMGYLNAKFIVQSVNNFPAAVALLRECRGVVDLIAGTYGERTVKASAQRTLNKLNEFLSRLDQRSDVSASEHQENEK
jgi:hypothetical protein